MLVLPMVELLLKTQLLLRDISVLPADTSLLPISATPKLVSDPLALNSLPPTVY
jgi:hypothetical protein